MRWMLMAAMVSMLGVAAAQTPMVKSGPGGASAVEVVCVDAFRRADAATKRELERRFRSTIVLRCEATAVSGSGRLSHRDFAYRHKYAADTRVHTLRMTDFDGQLGEVYGSTVREFHIGLPAQSRPWVVVLSFGDDSTEIVFVSNP